MRSSNHSPLDSTGSATESTISSAVNDESNHAISNTIDTHKEINGKDSDDGSNAVINENSPDELVAKTSAIDVSSTNEDDDSGKIKSNNDAIFLLIPFHLNVCVFFLFVFPPHKIL